MKNYPVIKKIITGCELASRECVVIDCEFELSQYTLIKGYVSHKNKAVENAGVIVICVDKNIMPFAEKIIGLVFTDENGIYGISIKINEKCEYKMEVYSSYNKGDLKWKMK